MHIAIATTLDTSTQRLITTVLTVIEQRECHGTKSRQMPENVNVRWAERWQARAAASMCVTRYTPRMRCEWE
jgi:hypothetical protein